MSDLFYPEDPLKLRDEIRELVSLKYPVQRCSYYHLKVGPINYFWTKGTITTDPAHVHRAKGFQALLEVVERWRSAMQHRR